MSPQQLYDSPWNQPLAGWLLTAMTLVWLRQKPPGRLRAVLAIFALQLCVDNWLTGALNPLPQASPLNQPLAILFVILGDWRFFLLTEPRQERHRWLKSLGFALMVPVLMAILPRLLPEHFPTSRHTFLAYELLFLGLALLWRFIVLPLRHRARPTHKWTLQLANFEILQYALWAIADLLILGGYENGFLLRLVPNTLYYGLFLAFAAWKAPREVW